jgi:hypothetical protein
VGELKQKQQKIKEKKVLNRDEVYHGALEDILLGKETQYVSANVHFLFSFHIWLLLDSFIYD